MRKIMILLFVSFSLLQAEYPVFKTGQTKSYDASGNEVTDGSIKDDGYYQSGVSRSYTRDDINEIVTDNVTNLMWQDNSEVKTVRKSWSNASLYCENLALGGYSDWRLPRIKELESIVDISKSNPAIDNSFLNCNSSIYWSSTIFATTNINYACLVVFNSGKSGYSSNSSTNSVRCVRNGG